MADNNRNRRLSGLNPLAYLGVEPSTPPQLLQENREPTPNDYIGYQIGTIWLVKGTEEIWMLVDKSANVANWVEVTSGELTFHADDGNNAYPALGIINVVGGANIDTAIVPPNSNIITIGLQDNIVVPGTVQLSSLPNGVIVSDATGLLSATNGTDGQVLIGGAAAPIWTNITSADGSIVFTPGPNSLDIVAAPGAGGFAGLIDDLGTTADPDAAHKVTLAGGSLINTLANPANTITIAINDAVADASPQVIRAPAAGGTPSWGRIAAGAGITVTEPVAGVITITAVGGALGGINTVHTDGADASEDPGDTSVTIVGGNVVVTDGAAHTVTVGLTQGADGQVVIGATGLDPAWATIASADGSITFTPGANTLDLSVTAPGGFGGLIGDDTLTAAPDGAHKVIVAGGELITTNAAVANTITVGLDYPGDGTIPGADGYVLISSNAGPPVWAPITGSASVTVTPNHNSITLTAVGGGGSGIQVLDCISGTATPNPATPTVVYLEGDALAGAPVSGYNNITTIGTADVAYIKLNPAIALPNTSSWNAGIIYMGGVAAAGGANRFIHNYGTAGLTSFNTFLGWEAGNLTLAAGATSDTAIGHHALVALTSGARNTACGANSLATCSSGSDNTAYGRYSLRLLTTGSSNTAIGSSALDVLTTSSFNTAVGHNAQGSVTTGSANTTIGYASGTALTTGSNNVACGYEALFTAKTGNYNTAIGMNALHGAPHNYNIGIGYNAGSSLVNSNNICIANIGNAADDGVMRIGTVGTHFTTYVAGVYNRPTANTPGVVLIDSNSKLGSTVGNGSYLAVLGAGSPPEFRVLTSSDSFVNIALNGNDINITEGTRNSYAFSATFAVTGPSITGDGTEYYMGTVSDLYILAEEYDYGSNFYGGNGIAAPAKFTAPVNGIYSFIFQAALSYRPTPPPPPPAPITPYDPMYIKIWSAGGALQHTYAYAYPLASVYPISQAAIYPVQCKMLAGEYATFSVSFTLVPSTKIIYLEHGQGNTYVAGHLIAAI